MISPKVAEATDTVVARSTPSPSRIGPNDPAVPCPPTIGIDPVARPSNGDNRKAVARDTPTIFCKMTSKMARSKKVITFLPPCFNKAKLAVNPILVKNVVMNRFCKDVSKFMAARLV